MNLIKKSTLFSLKPEERMQYVSFVIEESWRWLIISFVIAVALNEKDIAYLGSDYAPLFYTVYLLVLGVCYWKTEFFASHLLIAISSSVGIYIGLSWQLAVSNLLIVFFSFKALRPVYNKG